MLQTAFVVACIFWRNPCSAVVRFFLFFPRNETNTSSCSPRRLCGGLCNSIILVFVVAMYFMNVRFDVLVPCWNGRVVKASDLNCKYHLVFHRVGSNPASSVFSPFFVCFLPRHTFARHNSSANSYDTTHSSLTASSWNQFETV